MRELVIKAKSFAKGKISTGQFNLDGLIPTIDRFKLMLAVLQPTRKL
jgi:hypothetical protein